jgi:hypothetical protein
LSSDDWWFLKWKTKAKGSPQGGAKSNDETWRSWRSVDQLCSSSAQRDRIIAQHQGW